MTPLITLLTTLIIAAVGSSAIAAGAALIIQLGKLLLPGLFPDSSADNWRLLICVVVASVACFGPMLGLHVSFAELEQFFLAMSALGGLLMPLVAWLASLLAQRLFYGQLLRGVALLGKSYSLTRAGQAKAIK